MLILLLTVQALLACSSTLPTEKRIVNEGQIVIGHYIYGHEVDSFKPCRENGIFWVTGPTQVMETIHNNYKKHSKNPYDRVFIKIVADYDKYASDGFAQDYNGQIKIKKLIHMQKKNDKDCN